MPFRIEFTLQDDIATKLRASLAQRVADYSLYLFVGPTDLPPISHSSGPNIGSIPFEYPPTASVYCNMQLVQGKHVGLKKKANTALPADITKLINLTSWNKVEIRHTVADKVPF